MFGVWLISCGNTPYSDHPILLIEDDKLSTLERIVLVEKSIKDLNDDKMMAAVAVLYEHNKNWQSAYFAIQDAIKLSPLNPSYHTKKARYAYEMGIYEMAYEEARIADELGFESYQQDILFARLALTMADSIDATELMENVAQKYPNNSTVKYLSAILSLQKGDTAGAILLYEASLEQDSKDEEVTVALMNLLIELDSLNYANRLLTRIQNFSNTPEDYFSIQGQLYMKLGEIDSALQSYKYAFVEKGDTTSLKSLIEIYWDKPDYDSTLKYAQLSETKLLSPRYGLLTQARTLDKMVAYDSSLTVYLHLFEMDTTDSLVGAEMAFLQRKIAYLQRRREEQRKLADSLSRTMPVLTF